MEQRVVVRRQIPLSERFCSIVAGQVVHFETHHRRAGATNLLNAVKATAHEMGHGQSGVAQRRVDHKSNEITVVSKLFDALELSRTAITIDARRSHEPPSANAVYGCPRGLAAGLFVAIPVEPPPNVNPRSLKFHRWNLFDTPGLHLYKRLVDGPQAWPQMVWKAQW